MKTLEEVLNGLKEQREYALCNYGREDNGLDDFFEISEIAIEVFEKRVPKKPVIVTNMMTKEKGACCPSCRNFLSKTVEPYCCYCGQHLKWGYE